MFEVGEMSTIAANSGGTSGEAKFTVKFDSNVSSAQGGQVSKKSSERQLTRLLLTVSFVFLLLTLPIYIRHVVFTFIPRNTSIRTYVKYTLAFHVTNKLFITNSAINFLLYCITNKNFRSDVKQILCLKLWKGCCKIE